MTNNLTYLPISENGKLKPTDPIDHRCWRRYSTHFGASIPYSVWYASSMMWLSVLASHICWVNYYRTSGEPRPHLKTKGKSSKDTTTKMSLIFFHSFRQDSDMEHSEALMYAGGIVALSAVSGLVINQFFVVGFHNGMKVRVAVCSIIYRKVCWPHNCAISQYVFHTHGINFFFHFTSIASGFAVVPNSIGRHGARQSGQFIIKRCQPFRYCVHVYPCHVDSTANDADHWLFAVGRDRMGRHGRHCHCFCRRSHSMWVGIFSWFFFLFVYFVCSTIN